MSDNNRTVFQRDNEWLNKKNNATKASSKHQTQAGAIEAARGMLKNQGGGELTIQGRNGKFRDKNTISPGNDPFPPKG